jgi:integrase/recombinase XerD
MKELSKVFFRHLSNERGLSRNTCLAYSSDINSFDVYCDIRKIDIKKADASIVETYLWHLKSKLKLKPASIFRKTESIRSFYRFLMLEGEISKDPTKNFKTPRLPGSLPRFLSDSEIKTLLNFPAQSKFSLLRTMAAMELFYATGMRVSEALSLRLEAINMEQGWIRVMGKGSKERIVPVHLNAIRTLKSYLEARYLKFSGQKVSDELFVNRSGAKLSRVQMWKDIKKLAKLANMNKHIYPHLFRHTFASHLLGGGADLRSLQEMLGHASLNTTQIYTHIQKSQLKSAHQKFHPDK